MGEGTSEGRRLPSPAMVLAVAALIAALAGTAVAVDKIGSNDIAKNAVRSKHIKASEVKVGDADLAQSRFATATRTTSDGVELTDLNIAVQVKRGDIVSIQGAAIARNVGGSDTCRVLLEITGASLDEQPFVLAFGDATLEKRSFDGTADGSESFNEAHAIDYLATAAGKLRIRPTFFAAGPTTCEIRDRGLAVAIAR